VVHANALLQGVCVNFLFWVEGKFVVLISILLPSNLKIISMTPEEADKICKGMEKMFAKAMRSKKFYRQLMIDIGLGKKGQLSLMQKKVNRAFAASARSLRVP
jgi:hypothetical protein